MQTRVAWLVAVTACACAMSLALRETPRAVADPTPFLSAEDRANTIASGFDEPLSGEVTPTTTPTAGPALAAADRCAYFEIHAPSTNGGVMLYGGADDTTPVHQLPAGSTRYVFVSQLAELQFDGFDADDKITYLGYR